MEQFGDWIKKATYPCIQAYSDRLIELGASWDSFRREEKDVIQDLAKSGIPSLAAFDIYKIASEQIARSEAPMCIFWDIENVSIPTNVSGRHVAARIKSVLAPHGCLEQFRGYASIGLNHIPKEKRSELQLSGCHLVDCPHAGRKEVADKMIIVDAMKFAFSHPEGATLCFITGDVDYAYLLSTLQKPQWRTIVISKGLLQSMLHVNCTMEMRWETDILQLAPKVPKPVDDTTTQNKTDSAEESKPTNPNRPSGRGLKTIIFEAIGSLQDRNGSSLTCIKKVIEESNSRDRELPKDKVFLSFLKKAVKDGHLIENNRRYKISTESVVKQLSNKDGSNTEKKGDSVEKANCAKPNRVPGEGLTKTIFDAIRSLHNPNGSSQKSIKKVIRRSFPGCNDDSVNLIIAKAVKDGSLIRLNKRYKISKRQNITTPKKTKAKRKKKKNGGKRKN